jgi:hypothetical protein
MSRATLAVLVLVAMLELRSEASARSISRTFQRVQAPQTPHRRRLMSDLLAGIPLEDLVAGLTVDIGRPVRQASEPMGRPCEACMLDWQQRTRFCEQSIRADALRSLAVCLSRAGDALSSCRKAVDQHDRSHAAAQPLHGASAAFSDRSAVQQQLRHQGR